MSDFLDLPEVDFSKPSAGFVEDFAEADAKLDKMMSKIIWSEQDEEAFLQRVANNTELQAFLSQFSETSVDYFIKDYIRQRRFVVGIYKHILSYELKFSNQDKSNAEEFFWQIQHKKLYEAQCLWRAGKIDIPQIKITHDFRYWQHSVKHCPFIEPVQPEDIELLKQFLLEKGHELMVNGFWGLSFHDYDEFRSEDDDEGDSFYPPFYDYWDLRRGTGQIRRLPDVRGEQEDHYLSLYRNREKEEAPITSTFDPTYEYKPFLNSYNEDLVETFIKVSGDTEFLRYYKKHNERNEDTAEDEEYSLHELKVLSKGMPRDYPLEIRSLSWRKNIMATISKYKHELYASYLDEIYESYCLEREMGLELDLDDKQIWHMEAERQVSVRVRDYILQGRELAGEPRDWSFL